jgi:hypothetical protein
MRKEIKTGMFLVFLLLVGLGCDSALLGPLGKSSDDFNGIVYARYAPTKIEVMPLTEFAVNNDEQMMLKVYVSLQDSFGSRIKTPGVFRFELYERIERSSKRKGRRVAIWPDFDLNERGVNNEYWRDFLRAYEFQLQFEPKKDVNYVLEVMCMCPNGKRLLSEFGFTY